MPPRFALAMHCLATAGGEPQGWRAFTGREPLGRGRSDPRGLPCVCLHDATHAAFPACWHQRCGCGGSPLDCTACAVAATPSELSGWWPWLLAAVPARVRWRYLATPPCSPHETASTHTGCSRTAPTLTPRVCSLVRVLIRICAQRLSWRHPCISSTDPHSSARTDCAGGGKDAAGEEG